MRLALAVLCLLAGPPAFAAPQSADDSLLGAVATADSLYAEGRKPEAYAAYRDVVALHDALVAKKEPIGAPGLGAAAKSAFRLIEPKVAEFDAIRFRDSRTLSGNIKAKLALIQPLRDAYERVVLDYKHAEWSVAALYMIGKISDDFCLELRQIPDPPELQMDRQKELYHFEIEEQFRPVEDAALEYYAKAIQTSAQYGIRTEYTQLALDAVKRFEPAARPSERR